MAEPDREIFRVLKLIKGLKPSEIVGDAKRSNGKSVSPSTIANWRKPVSNGGTRYPQHDTLAAVARSAGYAYQLVPIERKQKP